jgi:hypothetical protein
LGFNSKFKCHASVFPIVRHVNSVFFNFATSSLKHFNYTRQDQQENGSPQANENDLNTIPNEKDDIFLGLDDVPGNWIVV